MYPDDRSDLNYYAYFDTGCIGLQSCIEMQPKKCMQPADKLEFISITTSLSHWQSQPQLFLWYQF